VGSGAARPDELEVALREAFERGRTAWPGITLAAEAFVDHLARHLRGGSPLVALKGLHTDDLWLACACLSGSPEALRAFEEHFVPEIHRALHRMKPPEGTVDETVQLLRHRFFVGDGPKIAEYSGSGPLRNWVRAAAFHAALRVVRKPKGQVEGDEETLRALASPESDLELDYLKRLYSKEVLKALSEGFEELSVRERNLLRQYFGLGLGIDEIGNCYRVHRATAARWVTKAREALTDKTRERLGQRLRLKVEDISSILRLTQSTLGEGLRSLFTSANEVTT
jgi:RNA polymerase sigma-70 factor (ECF subfamily)